MCLTIPKKVIEISEKSVVVQTHTGDRQTLKTIVESLKVGDFVISQQNIIIEVMDKENAKEILSIIKNQKGENPC